MNARCGLNALITENPNNVITFEYHYGDDFENDFTVQRTNWYHVISHPYAYFDGLNPVVGASNCLVATDTYRSRYDDRMNETWGESPIDISGQFADLGDEWMVTANYTLVDNVPLDHLEATLLLYEDNIEFCCGPGGNSNWNGVVRLLHDQPITLTLGSPQPVSTTFALDPSWNRSNLHLVAYVQNTQTREIIHGQRVTQPTTGVAPQLELADLLTVTPNPARGPLSITVDLSRMPAGSARLELLDVAGREIAEIPGTLNPSARTVLSYDPAALAPGIYFLRLTSQGRAEVQKFIRIR